MHSGDCSRELGGPADPQANLLGLLIESNPSDRALGWGAVIEDSQAIADLQIRDIGHLHHYADPAIGLFNDRGTLPFIPDKHPRFRFVRREPSATTELYVLAVFSR